MHIDNCKVIVISTTCNVEGSLFMNILGEYKIADPNRICPGPTINAELYVISDEEFNVGDHVVFNAESDLFDFPPRVGTYEMNIFDNNKKKEFKNTRKIIATTDKKLGLPGLPQDLIQAFIDKHDRKVYQIGVEYLDLPDFNKMKSEPTLRRDNRHNIVWHNVNDNQYENAYNKGYNDAINNIIEKLKTEIKK